MAHLAFVIYCLVAAPADFVGAASQCRPRVAEKLGSTLVEVCATSRGAVEGSDDTEPLPSFWINAAPVGCSAGAHPTLECPVVSAIAASDGLLRINQATAAIIDAPTAHRTCALRWGGRLPTRREREQARRVLGLTSVLFFRDDRGLGADELAEWTAEGECDQPSAVTNACRITMTPPVQARPRAPARALIRCDSEASPFVRSVFALGEICPIEHERSGGCALSLTGTVFSSLIGLRCHPPIQATGLEAAERPRADLAAFRCVLPPIAVPGKRAPGH